MDMPVTLGLAAGFLALAAFCGWMGARPPNLIKGPRLIPYRLIMLLAAAGAILMLTHVVNLAGFKTGANRPGF